MDMGNISNQIIGQKIHFIRSHRVILDSDLAELYGVPPKRLNEQVKRNNSRFPEDFMFRLTVEEYESLRSQIATLEKGRGRYRKYLPFAFTEQGVAMLSSVLNSERAVQVNIEIMRAFVRVRELILVNKELARQLSDLEHKCEVRFRYHDKQFKGVFAAIRQLISPTLPANRRRVGF
jgi:hypothetical protein